MPTFNPDQIDRDSTLLVDRLKIVVDNNKPADMDTDKVIGRIGIVAEFGSVTRTTVLGSLLFAAIHAPIVGITKAQLLKAVDEGFDAMATLESTPAAAQAYAEANVKSVAQGEATALSKDYGQLVMPGDMSKVH